MFKILNSQKGVVQIFFILILLVGIVAGVLLVQKNQIFKPKAYDIPNVTLTDSSGIKLPESVSDPNVYLLLNLPKNWELSPSEGPINFLPLIKNAYAQNSCPQSGDGTTTTCGVTDNTGRVFLGNQHGIFHSKYLDNYSNIGFAGGSALIKFTFDNQRKYAALSLSYLNTLYFSNNQNQTTIHLPFSQLVDPPKEKEYKYLRPLNTSFQPPVIPSVQSNSLLMHIFNELKVNNNHSHN